MGAITKCKWCKEEYEIINNADLCPKCEKEEAGIFDTDEEKVEEKEKENITYIRLEDVSFGAIFKVAVFSFLVWLILYIFANALLGGLFFALR